MRIGRMIEETDGRRYDCSGEVVVEDVKLNGLDYR